ncbi:hypothetical protein I553_10613 [Mycobacterium xenopi 4042]|uniref:Uncharacterized protein n=1 Tax=Mycobacterium xenopi 4042 TaxID=1299334 RepID=X7ZG45_MYCXE|nr:hypothetical protein I553_10613 [Mycobacterium xenopi 4042]
MPGQAARNPRRGDRLAGDKKTPSGTPAPRFFVVNTQLTAGVSDAPTSLINASSRP